MNAPRQTPLRRPSALSALFLLLLASAHSLPAATMPSQGQILSDMVLANTHFLNEWPTPGCTSCLSGGHPSNIWTRGTYFEGALALWRINQDPAIYTYAVNWGTFFSWKLRGADATDFLPDDECCGASYIELYQTNTTQTQYLTHITANMNAWLANSNLSLCYYVDALHMALPAWAKLGSLHVGVINGNATYLSRMGAYFNNAKTTLGLYNTTDHLWYRDSTFKTGYKAEDGTTQKCYWSRGEGWVFVALARILDVLPTTDGNYTEYVQTFQNMAAAIQATQRSDGFWNVNLAYANDYPGPESSGTAMFVYGMAWGINKGYLPINTYLPTVIAGWNALAVGALHHTTGSDNGFLGYEQGSGDEPSSGQPVTYTSVPDFDDFGLGAFLLAGSEVYALNALPTITTPPASQTVTADQPASFTVQAAGNPAPAYNWQLSTDGGNTWGNLTDDGTYSGSATATLTIANATAAMNGDQFSCVASNLAGSANSTAASLTVNLTAKMLWQQTYFTTAELNNSAISGDTADPANDGVSNLLKYALNLDPWTNSQSLLPQAQLSGNNLTLTYQQLRSDVTYTVQVSTDLQTWTTSGITLQTSGSTVTASYPLTGKSQAFLRLVITSSN